MNGYSSMSRAQGETPSYTASNESLQYAMNVSSEHIVSSPFGDIDTPVVDLYSAITARAGQYLDSEALRNVVTGECYTYRRLVTEVGAVSRCLSRQGFRHNSVLAVFSDNCPEVLVMAMAAWRLGGAVAGINHLLKTDEVHRQLCMSDAEFLFTISALAPTALKAIRDTRVKNVYATGESPGCVSLATLTQTGCRLPASDNDDHHLEVNPRTDTAIILFSSGTTGSSKGVQLTHYNFVAVALCLSHPALSTHTTAHVVIFQPLTHVFGLSLVVVALQLGRTAHLLPRFQLDVYLDVVSKYKIETLLLVPTIAILLSKSELVDRYDLSCVRYISCGSAPLGSEVEEEIKRRLGTGLYIGQGYGLTETSSVLTLTPNHMYGVTLPPATVGQPLPGTEMKVIDLKTGQRLPPQTRGEICARGPQIMKGYLKNDKATRDMIDSDGWLHTGDIGYFDRDGYFFVIDRLKELIKYNSYQVVPSELEAMLLTHPAVVDAGVFGRPDARAGELPTALVVRASGATVTEKDIQEYVKDKVASFKQLRGGVFFVASVPRTATGKLIRRAMRSMLSAKSNL